MELKLANRSILNCLELAAEKGVWIYITKKHRNLGKTTALVEFARLNHYTILVPNSMLEKHIKQWSGYRNVKSINSLTLNPLDPIVFEEGCKAEDINKLINKGHIVVTGFMLEN